MQTAKLPFARRSALAFLWFIAAGSALFPLESQAAGMGASGSSLAWNLPKGWKDQPATSMRLASFQVPVKGGNADASIVVLGGDAGGVTANVNRWRGQAGLDAVSPEEIAKSARAVSGKLGKFDVYRIAAADAAKDSILAAIIRQGERTIFVKLSGKQNAIREQEKNFLALCKSLREEHAKR